MPVAQRSRKGKYVRCLEKQPHHLTSSPRFKSPSHFKIQALDINTEAGGPRTGGGLGPGPSSVRRSSGPQPCSPQTQVSSPPASFPET
jgi:hypothetical protein